MENQFAKASWGDKNPDASDEKVWVYSTVEHYERRKQANLPQAIYRGDHGPSNQLKNATEMKPVGEQGQRLVCAFTAAFEQRKLNGVAPFTDEEIRMFVEGWSWADNDAIYQHRKHQSVKPEAR